jgi:hypothetical protein
LKHIEQLYEKAEIVYRDYDRPHSPAKEADILLSPSTGLIMTTLQQIKQRPLPGQPDRSPVKERMTELQSRYERLVVIVSEGLSRDMEKNGSGRPKDLRDQEAIQRMEGTASKLEGEVIIKYAPGGEQTLAHYLVAEMVNYGLPHGSEDIGDIKPVAVETTVSFMSSRNWKMTSDTVIVGSLPPPSRSQPVRRTGHHRFAQRFSRFAAAGHHKLAIFPIAPGLRSFGVPADERERKGSIFSSYDGWQSNP